MSKSSDLRLLRRCGLCSAWPTTECLGHGCCGVGNQLLRGTRQRNPGIDPCPLVVLQHLRRDPQASGEPGSLRRITGPPEYVRRHARGVVLVRPGEAVERIPERRPPQMTARRSVGPIAPSGSPRPQRGTSPVRTCSTSSSETLGADSSRLSPRWQMRTSFASLSASRFASGCSWSSVCFLPLSAMPKWLSIRQTARGTRGCTTRDSDAGGMATTSTTFKAASQHTSSAMFRASGRHVD